MNRKHGAVGAALAALTLITACGSQPATTTATRSAATPSGRTATPPGRAVACPATAPHPGLPPDGAGGAALVPAGPLAVAICQYAGNGRAAGMPGRVTLTGVAAAGLAAVLDSAQPVTSSARRCDRPGNLDPFAQELIFRYARGPERRVTVDFTDCNLGLVATSTQAGELPLQTDADLFEYTSITTRRDGSAPAPALIGLSAAAAVRLAHRQRFTVNIDGAVLDQGAAAGTVVFQSPPAGARDGGPGRDVDVDLATGRAPACAAGQLALSYLGGAGGAGNDFGTLLLRDNSARPCTLSGPLRVTGLGADRPAGHDHPTGPGHRPGRTDSGRGPSPLAPAGRAGRHPAG